MEDKIVSPLHNDKILSPITNELTAVDSDTLSPISYTFGKDTETTSAHFQHAVNSSMTPASRNGEQPIALAEPVWIKTRRQTLSSGFEYNRVLFNLRIDPTKWEEFSSDVTKASRLNSNDKAAVIATITGFSMLGLAGVGIVLGERVEYNKKLKRLVTNRQEGGLLAKVLESWNENYFRSFGVRAWIEVNEAALRDQARKSGEKAPDFVRCERSFVEKTPFVVFNKESWKRRKEERKYMVVLSPLEQGVELDSKDLPAEIDPKACEFSELSSTAGPAQELPSSDLIELAGDFS
jgi:hypothetical protein